jgi:adenylate kinase family enzyme
MQLTKKIVCLWGGPGTGKSTTCSGIFNLLKKDGYNCEMNREYIKDWVWEGRKVLDGDQVYITAKQLRKEKIYIREGIDFIITDSPAALCTFYGDKYDKYEQQFNACKQIVKQHHQFCKDHGYKIEHYFLVRTKAYNQAGRLQDEVTAISFDIEIKKFMDEYPINYKVFTADSNVEQQIVNDLLNRIPFHTVS